MEELVCKHCGIIQDEATAKLSVQVMSNGLRHLRADCCECGGWIKYLSKKKCPNHLLEELYADDSTPTTQSKNIPDNQPINNSFNQLATPKTKGKGKRKPKETIHIFRDETPPWEHSPDSSNIDMLFDCSLDLGDDLDLPTSEVPKPIEPKKGTDKYPTLSVTEQIYLMHVSLGNPIIEDNDALESLESKGYIHTTLRGAKITPIGEYVVGGLKNTLERFSYSSFM